MRIAPSPSGGLHIGHAMTACLSFLFVQKYGGKFYVRIEDTNPNNIYKPAYNLIKKILIGFLIKRKNNNSIRKNESLLQLCRKIN